MKRSSCRRRAILTGILLGGLISALTSSVHGDEPPAAAAAMDAAPLDFTSARSLLEQSCADCHGTEEGEGDFSLTEVADEESLGREHETWARVRQRLADRSM